MKLAGHRIKLSRDQLLQLAALAFLLIVAGLAIAGPSGMLSWSENLRLRDQRRAEIAALRQEVHDLDNRVKLLHPDRADPDLVGELLRRNLNVVNPDEVVLTLDGNEP